MRKKKRLKQWTVAFLAVLAVQGAISLNAHSDLSDQSLELPEAWEVLPEEEAPDLEEYARQVLVLINEERAAAGLDPLETDKTLAEAAMVRAAELERQFSHIRPDGTKWSGVFAEVGLTCRTRAENIAIGHANPERVMLKWMDSPGHRKNILSSKYNYVGIGVHRTETGRIAWEQLFSKDAV